MAKPASWLLMGATGLLSHATAMEGRVAAEPAWVGPFIGVEASPGGLFAKYDMRLRNPLQAFQALTTGYGESRNDTPVLVGLFGGYNLQYPGDASLGASAGETVNCRCATLYI